MVRRGVNLERNFQSNLVGELKAMFPGCIVLKNDANLRQGFPDLTVLYRDRFVVLECKKSENEAFEPNQEYYLNHIEQSGGHSFVIYPENKDEVLHEVQRALQPRRNTRVSRS